MSHREKQLTFDPRGHQLTNINVWTPDSQWLAYDVRPRGASFTGLSIERVNVASGAVEWFIAPSTAPTSAWSRSAPMRRRVMPLSTVRSTPTAPGSMIFTTAAG